MSGRSHRSLRLGALVLLAAMALWPRARAASPTAELTASAQHRGRRPAAPRGVAARAETTPARQKLVSPPHTAKLLVADADDSQLTN